MRGKTYDGLAFDLPGDILASLQPRNLQSTGESILTPEENLATYASTPDADVGARTNHSENAVSCNSCQATFESFAEQRAHTRSDWHHYNLKQKMNGLTTVPEKEFDEILENLDISISGSDDPSSDDDGGGIKARESMLSALLKKQASLQEGPADDALVSYKESRGTGPLLWFSSPLYPPQVALGLYQAILTNADLQRDHVVSVLRERQLDPVQTKNRASKGISDSAVSGIPGPSVLLCMIGGGHFASMVVSLTPRVNKGQSGRDERQANVLAHKTFHRYTTRRKQGGSQSANDSSKGNAHSAGAGIRRANEAALQQEVRELLAEWKTMIQGCELLFIRATGNTNRRTLFGPYDNQTLHANDPR